jgi:transcriptional regulator with XRE-family HTH domain
MIAAGGRRGGDPLFRALAARVESTSLRQVAREVGMSPTGLRKVLSGASPYAPTRAKLERWLVREAAASPRLRDATSGRAALDLLLAGIPAGERSAASAELVAMLRALHERLEIEVPAWLGELGDTPAGGPVRS